MLKSVKRWHSACLYITLFITVVSCSGQPASYVNDVDQARKMLQKEREQALSQLETRAKSEALNRLVDLGLWKKVQTTLNDAGELSGDLKLVQAWLLMKKHRYQKAEKRVAEVLEKNPGSTDARLLRAELYIQAWELQKAAGIANELMKENARNPEAGLIKGKVALLNRDYDASLNWAKKVQQWDSKNAEAYLLEAESLFWAQKPEAAEPALVRALELNPFSADARFKYGYAIWRRVDATQLDEMAAQWNLAFEVNPLHYLTHWHFGNGHTNLTYADYVHPSDSVVNASLDKADILISQDKLDRAIAVTRKVGAEYPESVHPAMMRGSIYYMAYNLDRSVRLDSAASLFKSILERKENYGPAHNGLAAVIKQRQIAYLADFDSLERAIRETKIPPGGDVFYEVFKDAAYYPGDRVAKMIAQQIGPSKAYLPLINKFGSDFAIPPLHTDLAEAMDNNYFRYGTTFDNRQWMDIRGVGSGAAGIEYVERGSHLERNVLAHEYAHLYHGRILTNKESRRIRALYHAAMKNDRALDYYASNNESEFFAQGYAGFLSAKKVHPLSHKSMNTRSYIRKKDPAFYTFLDSLLRKQKKYLAGNVEVFDDNWAQAYLSLAERSQRNGNLQKAIALLDTALTYSAGYIPAILAYAEVNAERGNFDAAQKKVAKARQLDKAYAPVYVTKAMLVHQKALQGMLTFGEAMEQQIPLFEKALRLEKDLAYRARFNRVYRQRYRSYGRTAEAIKVAERYLKDAPVISTYLRDRKDEAVAYAHYLRSLLGYPQKAIGYFKTLTDLKPQNFEFRLMYADVLMKAGRLEDALAELKESQQILTAAGNRRTDFALRIARIHLKNGDISKAEDIAASVKDRSLSTDERLMLARIYADLGRIDESRALLADLTVPKLPAVKSDFQYTKAVFAEASGETSTAIQAYQKALVYNPYHLKARAALIKLVRAEGKTAQVTRLKTEAASLTIPLGPYFDDLLNS
ncbi:MAG TPA: tetratricopeptide repeat protein [Balneolaceae bacterium]